MSFQSVLVRSLLRRSGMWNKPLLEIRKDMANLKAKKLPEGISEIRDKAGRVPCKVFFNKEAGDNKVILYFHGGGFCLGIYPSNSEFVAEVAKLTGTKVYMPDYRLAPENPYPAALEDAVAVYREMLEKGYSAEDIIIMGDSSGCALAVSALLKLKQEGVRMPKGLAFITPLFDLTGSGDTYLTRAAKDPFRIKDPLGLAKNYSSSVNPTSPMISPLFGDLTGLPLVVIHAADYDVFLSDSVRFSEKVKASGGRVVLKVWAKMWHIFHMQAAAVPESKKALEELCKDISGLFLELNEGLLK